MPRLPIQWNDSAAQASLAPVASSPEYVIPLWWYSGGVSGTAGGSSAGIDIIQKGSTSIVNSSSITSAAKLHTLNASWPATTKFAFETSLVSNNASYTAYAALWDVTANAVISASQVSTTSTTQTVARSGQFTLPAGHVLAVTFWTSNGSSGSCIITDASLVVFPS